MNYREEERDLSALYCTVLYCVLLCFTIIIYNFQ